MCIWQGSRQQQRVATRYRHLTAAHYFGHRPAATSLGTLLTGSFAFFYTSPWRVHRLVYGWSQVRSDTHTTETVPRAPAKSGRPNEVKRIELLQSYFIVVAYFVLAVRRHTTVVIVILLVWSTETHLMLLLVDKLWLEKQFKCGDWSERCVSAYTDV